MVEYTKILKVSIFIKYEIKPTDPNFNIIFFISVIFFMREV
jgi:hypothetical protein